MNDEKFEKVYDLYKLDVYRLAYSYTQCSSDAEDITQKVFVKLYRNFQKVNNGDEKFWLIKVTSNECKNFKKSFWIRKRKNVSSEDLNFKEDEKDFLILYSSLKKIPEKYRICIHLYYFYGYNLNEISTLLNLNVNTVKTRIKRSKEFLKKEMEDKG